MNNKTEKKKENKRDTEINNEKEDILTMYVGSKPLIRYLIAIMAIYLNKRPEKFRIAARGRAISRAVDVAEVLRSRYLKDVIDVKNIEIFTEKMKNKKAPNKIDRVSSIEIILKKN